MNQVSEPWLAPVERVLSENTLLSAMTAVCCSLQRTSFIMKALGKQAGKSSQLVPRPSTVYVHNTHSHTQVDMTKEVPPLSTCIFFFHCCFQMINHTHNTVLQRFSNKHMLHKQGGEYRLRSLLSSQENSCHPCIHSKSQNPQATDKQLHHFDEAETRASLLGF